MPAMVAGQHHRQFHGGVTPLLIKEVHPQVNEIKEGMEEMIAVVKEKAETILRRPPESRGISSPFRCALAGLGSANPLWVKHRISSATFSSL